MATPGPIVGARSQANVALIVETSVIYGREILKGISRYLSVHGRWSVFLDERELDAPPPDWLHRVRFVLADQPHRELPRKLRDDLLDMEMFPTTKTRNPTWTTF